MAGTTPKLALRYPSSTDADDVPSYLQQLATDVEGAISGSGLLSARPAAGRRGRFYEATDTGQVFRDNGTTWDELTGGLANRSARAFRIATSSVVTGTPTPVGLDGEAHDTNALHDVSTNNSRLVLNAVGKWLVVGQVGYVANTAGVRQARVRLNGSSYDAYQTVQPVAGAVTAVQVTALVVAAAITDYAELIAYQDSGSSLGLSVGANETWLSATFLGT